MRHWDSCLPPPLVQQPLKVLIRAVLETFVESTATAWRSRSDPKTNIGDEEILTLHSEHSCALWKIPDLHRLACVSSRFSEPCRKKAAEPQLSPQIGTLAAMDLDLALVLSISLLSAEVRR